MTAILQEQEAPIQNKPNLKLVSNLSLETRVYLAYKHRTANRRHSLKEIIRANIEVDRQLTAKTKYISAKAVNVAEAVMNKILYDKNDIILGHKYLTKITRCMPSQNSNILKELGNLYEIQYHRAIFINGNFYEHHYTFKLHHSIVQELKDTSITNSEFYPQKIVGPYTNNKDVFNKDIRSVRSKNFQNSNIKNSTELSDPQEVKKNEPKRKNNIRKKPTNAQRKARVYNPNFKQYSEMKNLAYHYPLSTQECTQLQMSSGRDFTLNATNEILQDMSRKLERTFCSKAQFLVYFGKCLKYENRDAVATANTGFYIKANKTEAEIIELTTLAERENYLNYIETEAIMHVNPENQLRAKLANSLPPSIAYNLLSKLKYFCADGNTLIIHLSSEIVLSELNQEIILQEANAVGGGYAGVTELEITTV